MGRHRRWEGVWVHELVSQHAQEGPFLVFQVEMSLSRGIKIPILGSAWAGDRGVQVEGVVRYPEARRLLSAEGTTKVHTDKTVVEGGHLWCRRGGLGTVSSR